MVWALSPWASQTFTVRWVPLKGQLASSSVGSHVWGKNLLPSPS